MQFLDVLVILTAFPVNGLPRDKLHNTDIRKGVQLRSAWTWSPGAVGMKMNAELRQLESLEGRESAYPRDIVLRPSARHVFLV